MQQRSPASLLLTLTIIVTWYLTNILVLLTNKYLLSSTGFRQPVRAWLLLACLSACSRLSMQGEAYASAAFGSVP
jgi:hypothetical protein